MFAVSRRPNQCHKVVFEAYIYLRVREERKVEGAGHEVVGVTPARYEVGEGNPSTIGRGRK
jgi:hypothetical protein